MAATNESGRVAMAPGPAAALAALRAFNYERIYTRPESLAQSAAVIAVLTALVGFYCDHPGRLPSDLGALDLSGTDLVRAAVTYVGGMTDRFAFDAALTHLGWDPDRLPKGQ